MPGLSQPSYPLLVGHPPAAGWLHFDRTEAPVLDHSQVLAADTALLRELHLAMLGCGILFTQRGMGCLSTPMTGSEVDAFVEAAQLGLGELGVA